MSSALSSSQIRSALKTIMKKKKYGYSELSKHLGVSLPTVKRIMSKDEMQVGRLLEICDWLDVKLSDLEKLATTGDQRRTQFTEKQEKFLSENSNYMSFLFHMYAGETPSDIQKKYNISKKSLELYLIRLERQELIKKKLGVYIPAHLEFPKMIPFGALSKQQTDQVLDVGSQIFKRYNQFQNRRKDPELDRGRLNNIIFCTVSRASYLTWFEKFKALNLELQQLSDLQDYQKNIKDRKLIGMMHLHGIFEVNDPEIDSLKNMFGRVVELEK